MKKLYALIPFMLIASITLAFGQDATDVFAPTQDDFKNFANVMASLGGTKTLGTLGIVLAFVQFVMLITKSYLGQYMGKFRLLVLLGLTVPATIIGLKIQGMDWITACMSAATVSAFQVFGNQVYKQLLTDKGNK